MKIIFLFFLIVVTGCKMTNQTSIKGSTFKLDKEQFINGVKQDCEASAQFRPSYCNSEEELQIWIEHMMPSIDITFTFDSEKDKVKVNVPAAPEETTHSYAIIGDTISIKMDDSFNMDLIYNKNSKTLEMVEMATPIIYSVLKN